MQYRREIDGLRAVAVLPVMFFHAGFGMFAGGYVGVDIFLVISGYLITSILLSELSQGKFSIRKFYERRARRILPALFFVQLCCIPFAWILMLPAQFKEFAQGLVAVSLFASNILFWRKTDYFAAAAEENPLLHTWSLAVEEQFYIIFPLMLLLLWRFGRNRALHGVIALSAASLLLTEWGWRYAPAANFYLIPFRAWELGAGSLCAFVMQRAAPRESNFLSLTGMLLIALSIFCFDHTTPFPSLYALAPVGGTALIILYGSSPTSVAGFLSQRVLVGIGLVSYSAYLWHQPLFAFARRLSLTHPSAGMMMLLTAAALTMAYLSWRFIEQPFRRRPSPLMHSQRAVFAASTSAATVFIAVGLYGHMEGGAAWRLPAIVAEIENRSRGVEDIPQSCVGWESRDMPIHPVADCLVGHGKHKFALIGDSHASVVFKALAAEVQNDDVSLYLTTYAGCPPVTGMRRADRDDSHQCAAYNQQLRRHLISAGYSAVIVLARWALHVEGTRFTNGEGGSEAGRSVNLAPAAGEDIEDREARRSWVSERLSTSISELSRRIPVVLVYPIPEAGWHVPNRAARIAMLSGLDRIPDISTSYSVFQERNRLARAALDAVETEKVWRVFPANHLCNVAVEGRCINTADNDLVYFDDDHVTRRGASYFTPAIRKAMLDVISRNGRANAPH